MSMIKLSVPLLVGDQMRNPGEEVDMTDEGRVAFVMGMKYAEEVTPPEGGVLSAKHPLLGDKPHDVGDKSHDVGDKPNVEPVETHKKGK